MKFGEEWKPWSSSLHDCLLPLITCAPLIEHLRLYFPSVWEMGLHTSIQQQPNYKCVCLTLNIPVVCACAAGFTLRTAFFPTQCIRVLMWFLTINIHYLHIQHSQMGLSDGSTLFCACARACVRAVNLSVSSRVRFGFKAVETFRQVSRRLLTVEARVRSRASPCGICSGQSCTGIVFSARSSFSPCPCHATNVPYCYKKDKRRNLLICKQSNALSNIRNHRTEKSFYIVWFSKTHSRVLDCRIAFRWI